MSERAEHRDAGEIAALAMMPEGDAERVAFEAHAAGCASCGAEWKRAARMAALVGTLAPPPAPASASLARAQAAVHAALDADAPTQAETKPAARTARAPEHGLATGPIVGACVLAAAVGSLAMAGDPISTGRVVLALATIAVAALLPSFAARSEKAAGRVLVSALALSCAIGGLDYRVLAMEAGHAMGCLEHELVVAALPLAAAGWLTRSAGRRVGAMETAAAGAAGALAGQGVLLSACAADESVLHVLAFHVAGVAVAALAGGLVGRTLARA